jgi:hypothetical protein
MVQTPPGAVVALDELDLVAVGIADEGVAPATGVGIAIVLDTALQE